MTALPVPAPPASRSPLPATPGTRERLWSHGAQTLTASELLAILLGTGGAGRSAVEVAAGLLVPAEGSLRRLAARPAGELRKMPGVGLAEAARLPAALEVGARLARAARPEMPGIR